MISDSLKERIKTVFFPKRCKYCGKVITPTEELCRVCENDLPEIKTPVCRYCGMSKDDCSCRKRRNYYSSLAAPYYYELGIKSAVDRMKFQSREYICHTMAEDILKTVKREYKDIDFDFITFVPMSPSSAKKRDFNQAEIIAKHLSRELKLECKASLICNSYDTSQHFEKGFGRISNVFSCFDVISKDDIKDKVILLVDDVKTTGATLNECSKMLLIFGAESVYTAAFAVARLESETDIDS